MLNTKSLQGFREQTGLTQGQLGEVLNVTRQTIAAWEKGEREPSLIQLSKIANEFSIPIDLLLHREDVKAPTLLFRADKADVLSKELRQLSTRIAEDYAVLEKLLGEIPTVPESRPLEGYDEHIVEKIADAIRDWLGIEDTPLGDVLALLEGAGIKIIRINLPSQVSGFSAYTDAWGGVIFINKNHKPERQYFTALHELAHLIFHRNEYNAPTKKVTKSDPREKVAQHFAGAVLLSRKALEEELRGFGHTWLPMPLLEDIKQRYNVSIRTVIFRAGYLGIISKKQMGQQIGIINREHGFENEPGEIQAPKLLGRLKRLVFKALIQEKITVSKAAEVLRVKPKYIRAELVDWLDEDNVSEVDS